MSCQGYSLTRWKKNLLICNLSISINDNKMAENNSKRIEFTDKDFSVLISLKKVMEGFIIFYFVLTLLYIVLTVYLFINGNEILHIKQQSFVSFIPIIIGLVSLYLARELHFAKKNITCIIDADETQQHENIGKIFRRLKRFFVLGAFFLFAFITGFMVVMIMLIFNM